MKYHDLRDFISQLEARGELKRITVPVDTHLEMTEIADRVLRAGGPALLFEKPVTRGVAQAIPVLANLFGTPQRVMRALGVDDTAGVRRLGQLLAELKEPSAPERLRDVADMSGLLKSLWHMTPQRVGRAPCQQAVLQQDEVDLRRWPVQKQTLPA